MAISFSSAARAEICRELPHTHCCAKAECFGILLFCNSFQDDGIKIITESREFACILPKLFIKAFNLSLTAIPVWPAPESWYFRSGIPKSWGELWKPSALSRGIRWRCT